MIHHDNEHHDKRDAEKLKDAGETVGMHSKIDPAGTDPNRYRSVSSGKSHNESGDNEYDKEPKNHTSPNERMINPDRGE